MKIKKFLFSTRPKVYTSVMTYIWSDIGASDLAKNDFENILKNILDITVFLDDIKIASTNVEKHFEILELVLSHLLEYNVRINLEKCIFLKDQISYLNYIIRKDIKRKNKRKWKQKSYRYQGTYPRSERS